jgi:hypothetical protein
LRDLFVTRLYEASVAGEPRFAAFRDDLEAACDLLATEDLAGRAWSKAHGYGGYTSYASLDDLPRRATVFGELKRRLDRHAALAAAGFEFDLGGGRLALDSMWVSVLSGVIYITAPPGAGALRLEDPRLPLMMAAPPRRADAAEPSRAFVTLQPAAGAIYIWESWLRHEVLPGKGRRISLSFNYAWR